MNAIFNNSDTYIVDKFSFFESALKRVKRKCQTFESQHLILIQSTRRNSVKT